MLTRRLTALVGAGLLERRRYSERPPRYEYVLKQRGREFRPVLIALAAWGNRHFAPEGPSVVLIDRKSRRTVDPVLVDRKSGRSLNRDDFVFAAGPAAREGTRRRYATIDQNKPTTPQRRKSMARNRKRRA